MIYAMNIGPEKWTILEGFRGCKMGEGRALAIVNDKDLTKTLRGFRELGGILEETNEKIDLKKPTDSIPPFRCRCAEVPVMDKELMATVIIEAARALCGIFIAKVETGQTKSVETYADCKNLLAIIREWEQ